MDWRGLECYNYRIKTGFHTHIRQKTTNKIDLRSPCLGNMFGLTKMITGTVFEEDTEDEVDKLSAVNNNNMNKSDTLTPTWSGTI